MLGAVLITSCCVLRPQERTIKSLQAVVVKTDGWDRVKGVLQGYERISADSPWTPLIDEVPVVVGRNGMGWGIGLHASSMPEGPVKREGDGRAPAGIFKLSAGFGYAAAGDVSWIRLPYRQATPRLICIDDGRSIYYNRILDAGEVKPDWTGHEKMLRSDGLYRFGIVVDHNAEKPEAGYGSCIFMHIWQGPSKGTSGCTAMEAQHLERLLLWLDPAAMPVLIQMPAPEYGRLRVPWHLP